MYVPGWVAPPWQLSTEPPGHVTEKEVVLSGNVTVTLVGTHARPPSHEPGPGSAVKLA